MLTGNLEEEQFGEIQTQMEREQQELSDKIARTKFHVEATGASYSRFIRVFQVEEDKEEGVKKAAVYLSECMKERE